MGFTTDLGKRVAIHNQGGCPHTAKGLPWKVKTHLMFENERTARRFERYLKTGSGRAFAKPHFE